MNVGGWHAINRICVAAKVDNPERLTATKMRHRVSTLYAATEVPANDRNIFYKHMGHSADINDNIYQAPLAEAAITKVGIHLSRSEALLVRFTTAPTLMSYKT